MQTTMAEFTDEGYNDEADDEWAMMARANDNEEQMYTKLSNLTLQAREGSSCAQNNVDIFGIHPSIVT